MTAGCPAKRAYCFDRFGREGSRDRERERERGQLDSPETFIFIIIVDIATILIAKSTS